LEIEIFLNAIRGARLLVLGSHMEREKRGVKREGERRRQRK
jgi:hypothetical protein